MSILALAIIVSVGLTVGGFAKAGTLRDTILDKVADKIAEKILGSFDQELTQENQTVDEPILGFSTQDQFWVNNNSGVIYLGKNKDVGIRRSNGILQGLQSGTWSVLKGWVANGINNALYPSTNAGGTYYPVIIGVDATSSPATVDTELYVGGGGGGVFTGNVFVTGAIHSGNLTVDTNTLVVNAISNKVGIASTTPNAMLSVGAVPSVSSATSTIDFAKPCFKMATEDGTNLYMFLRLNANSYSNWATSTMSCF